MRMWMLMTGRALAVILKLNFWKSCDHKKSYSLFAYFMLRCPLVVKTASASFSPIGGQPPKWPPSGHSKSKYSENTPIHYIRLFLNTCNFFCVYGTAFWLVSLDVSLERRLPDFVYNLTRPHLDDGALSKKCIEKIVQISFGIVNVFKISDQIHSF
jgi:hypothetical protein